MEQVGASRGHFQAVSLCFLLRSPACPQARPMLARSPGLPKPWGSLGDPGSLSPELRVPVYAWPVSPLAAPQGRDRIPACPSRHLHPVWSLQPPDQALAPVPFSGAGPAGWRWARGRRVPRLSREVWGGPGGSAGDVSGRGGPGPSPLGAAAEGRAGRAGVRPRAAVSLCRSRDRRLVGWDLPSGFYIYQMLFPSSSKRLLRVPASSALL